VLRPGRDIQQRMVRIATSMDFDGIVANMRAQQSCASEGDFGDEEACIPVPQGPMEMW
jgi:hypothetical protein